VSTTDGATRVMKMANGGYSPAANVQLATDTESRAILGVDVSNESSDWAGLSGPMRQQVEQRTGGKVGRHLVDGGYLRMDDIVEAHQQAVAMFVPPSRPGTPTTGAMSWNPSQVIRKPYGSGNNAWPARRKRKSTGNGLPPAKP
jgi:hypothetical protein